MAARKIGDVFLKAHFDTDDATRGAEQQVRRSGGQVGGIFSKAFGGALAGVTAALGAVFAAQKLVDFASDALSEAREAAKVARLTEAAIKSTGGAAKVTAAQIEGLADEISTLVGVDDELIQSSENLLLTFTNIRNEVGKGNDIFNQAEKAVVDMTAAMNNGEITQDGLKTSTIQLGKALNDPIKGITALSKVGVTFTEQQKEQIKKFVESGKIMEAQKVILAELSKEFGGAAAAAADPAQRAAAAWGNFKEVLGNLLLPTVDKLMTMFTTNVVPFLQTEVLPVVTRLAQGFQEKVVPAVKLAAEWFGQHILPRLREFGAWVQEKVVPVVIQLGKVLFEDMKKGFNSVKLAIEENKPQLQQIFEGFKKFVDFIITKVVPVVGPFLQTSFKTLGTIISITIKQIAVFVDTLNWLKGVALSVANFFANTVPNFFRSGIDQISQAWARLKEAAKQPVRFVIETVINQGIVGTFNKIAGMLGVGTRLTPVGLPAGFAAGGIIPGRDIGRDNVLIKARMGEGIAVPELVKQIGPQRFMQWNKAARAGSRIPGFADGGIVGFFSNPAGYVTDALSAPLNALKARFGSSPIANLAMGLGGKVRDTLITKVRALFSASVSSLGQMMGGGGWQWQMAVLRQVFPGLPLLSGFRPGARVASGELSYHALGRAVDLPPLIQVFNWIKSHYGARTRELIFSPMGARQVWNGREHLFTGSVVPQHYNHIHWAYKLGGIVGRRGIPNLDAGGFLEPGINVVQNGTGRREPVGAGGLEQVLGALLAILAELRALPRGIGRAMTGGVATAHQLARGM